jgi:hypothetical protein
MNTPPHLNQFIIDKKRRLLKICANFNICSMQRFLRSVSGTGTGRRPETTDTGTGIGTDRHQTDTDWHNRPAPTGTRPAPTGQGCFYDVFDKNFQNIIRFWAI